MASTFQDHLAELFAPLGGVVFRRMFGGVGVFRDGLMFALVADDVLYMKADDGDEPGLCRGRIRSVRLCGDARQGDGDGVLANSRAPARGTR